ncbi:hypothetical protein [Halalkalibacter oceani]|uniref:hypothetical protein n=1 Tax=Halalkalibacter oceani TaxID=1653776 RepID=UPI0033940A8A
MKRLFVIGCVVVTVAMLAACSANENDEPDNPATADEQSEVPPADEEETETGNELESPIGSSDAAEIKEIPVTVEGETEMREAQFHRSAIGYSIYILQDFMLESEEPNRDVILSNYDDSFFTRVINHGSGADAQEIKQMITEHAEGEIVEGEDVPLADIEYTVKEEITNEDGVTVIVHTAKEYNGQLIGFTLFLPQKEAAEGISPAMWAMLDTIEW